MSDLEMLKEIKSKFDYLSSVDYYNKAVDKRLEQEIFNSAEKKKIEKIDRSKTTNAMEKTFIFSILTLVVLLAVPLLSYDAIYEHIMENQPDLLFDSISSSAWEVIGLAYLLFAALLIIPSFLGIFFPIKKEEHDDAASYNISLLIKIISILVILTYVIVFVVIQFSWLHGDFWGFLYGLFWPVVFILAFALQLIVLIFGWTFIPYAWIIALLFLLLIVNSFLALALTSLLSFIIETSEEKNISSERIKHVDEYNAKKKELQKKYRYEKIYADYTYEDVVNRYSGILPKSDINPNTVNQLIWCIENRYANDIVGAKRWLAQYAHNKKMYEAQQAHNQRMYEAQERTRKLAEEAASDAWAARKAAEKAKDAAEAPIDVTITWK